MVADFWPSGRRLEELREKAGKHKESSKVKAEERARPAGGKHAATKRLQAVELKPALEEAEPGGLTVGYSEFGADFFWQAEGCDRGGNADAMR